MVLMVVQGTIMASGIALVEELLFRSWLPQEIAVDLGYHRGIIISGLVFSFLQRFVFFMDLCFEYIIHALHFGFYGTHIWFLFPFFTSNTDKSMIVIELSQIL